MFLFSKPIALGDKIWIVKLRYNGSVSLYSGCKHTFSYIIYFEKLKIIRKRAKLRYLYLSDTSTSYYK